MNSKWLLVICFSAPLLTLVLPAHGELVVRLGGQAVYDTDRNLTWLADANAGAGSAFDDGIDPADGLMSWENANAWAASLTVGGVSDWRLPATLQPDPSCTQQAGGGTISTGGGCIGGEMGHLFYEELGGTSEPFNPPDNGVLESGDPDLALFTNIQAVPTGGGIYYSETERNAANAWYFNFNNGQQSSINKLGGHFAWAVRSGDVGLIPEPSAAGVIGMGMVWLFGSRRGRS